MVVVRVTLIVVSISCVSFGDDQTGLFAKIPIYLSIETYSQYWKQTA